MEWQMVHENLKTGKCKWHGSYPSRKMGLQYAPEVLDGNFDEIGVGIDEKDDLIGDFMQCGGKMAVVVGDVQFFLTKRMFDVCGKRVADPSGSVRIGGKAKWKDPDGGRVVEVIVDAIDSPEMVKCHTEDGSAVECPWNELSAA